MADTPQRASHAISMSLVLTLDVSPTWQECTAVCREAGELMLTGGVLLTPSRCRITSDGTLEVEPGRLARHDGTTACLSDLLAELLAGVEAPPEVRALAGADSVRRQPLGAGLALLQGVAPVDRAAAIRDLAERSLRVRAELTAETSPSALRGVGAFTLWRARERRRELERRW